MSDSSPSDSRDAEAHRSTTGSGDAAHWPILALETSEPTGFGRGWISGLISALAGVTALGAIVCIRFPGLTIAEVRGAYPVELIRSLLFLMMAVSLLAATISAFLRCNKLLPLVGSGATLLAAILGGSTAAVGESVQNTWLGLDSVVLNLLLYSAVYIPLERLFPLHPEQPTFRREWTTDLTYFFLSSLLVQILGLLTIKPVMLLLGWARIDVISAFCSGLPVMVQALLCVLVADLTQYWVHRWFHQLPILWRFHAIHHSAETMDWLAGSRLHLVDAIITRSLTYVPLFVLGFSEAAIGVYVIVVVIQATFIHANVRWQLTWLQPWVATPCFHHWHHAAEPQAIDKNFSVHSPIWDRIFGTYYMPGRWPERYGLCGPRDVPAGWLRQLWYPFAPSGWWRG